MNELELLTVITVFTGVIWMPVVLARINQQGLFNTVGYPETPPAVAPWADRAQRAHRNAIENLVVFSALLFVAVGAEVLGPVTLMATQLFVASRVAHYVCYVLAIPWLRTAAFFGGFVAQMTIAWTIFNQA